MIRSFWKHIRVNCQEVKFMLRSYVAFDLETTGLNPEQNEIIEIGALKVRDGKIEERFMEFIKPEEPISSAIVKITGITNNMVAGSRKVSEVIPEFTKFCGEDVLIGHNIMFDYKFTKKFAGCLGCSFEHQGIDTLKIARKIHKDLDSKSLGRLCSYYQIENKAAHRAYHDALATAKLYQMMAHYYEEKEPKIFTPVPLAYKPPKNNPATAKQKAFLLRLIAQHELDLSPDMDLLTMSEASRLINEILSGQMVLERSAHSSGRP